MITFFSYCSFFCAEFENDKMQNKQRKIKFLKTISIKFKVSGTSFTIAANDRVLLQLGN